MSDFLFSFHPGPAASLYAGEKRHEFRRVRVAIAPGDRVLVYEVAPVGAVTGEFVVAAVRHGPPQEVLRLESSASREQARPYLDGAKTATAIEAAAVRRYRRPLALADLGLRRPPQSYLRLPAGKRG